MDGLTWRTRCSVAEVSKDTLAAVRIASLPIFARDYPGSNYKLPFEGCESMGGVKIEWMLYVEHYNLYLCDERGRHEYICLLFHNIYYPARRILNHPKA